MHRFLIDIEKQVQEDTLVKITLSKKRQQTSTLNNVYVRIIDIKARRFMSFTYRYKTKDIVKNYLLKEALSHIEQLLNKHFKIAMLFSTRYSLQLSFSKRNKISYVKTKAIYDKPLSTEHNKEKHRYVASRPYLYHLGILNEKGEVLSSKFYKYKQINKYIEIVDGLLGNIDLLKPIRIVDMGAGKGYLTFALYDYLTYHKRLNVSMEGVESREDLVEHCNTIARNCGFTQLRFVQQTIAKYQMKKADILIALHACDTATDDALAKGIQAEASLIVCAPCCHKEMRQKAEKMKSIREENPILKYGIFKERQYEMATDTLRALLMRCYGYDSHIFEFVSNEHTRKNIMLVGVKKKNIKEEKQLDKSIEHIKSIYGIDTYYLEQLLPLVTR